MAIPTAWSVPASGQGEEGRQVAFAAIKPGSLLGNRYEIIDILGEGGMGAVYKARDRELDRMVALKVIRPELAGRPEILQRFKQELILARQVTHRNVIRIFDLGEAGGVKFITMEFVEGHDLKTVLASEGKLPPDRAVEIIQQVCLALEAAHSEGVVHRDLKPQNIMLDQQGRALVMDFGIARSLEFGGMTQTGALIGTPEYMSPEQVRGEHVDARSDLFTLGVIFQEILTGALPFQAETAMASMFKRTKERSVPVHQLDPAVPQYLSDIVAKCLEIEPQDRFQSAREICDALEAWKSGTAAPIRVGSLRWVRRALRNRSAFGFAAAGAALAVLLMVAVVAFRMYNSRKPAPHAPVSVLVADFTNRTGDPIFDGTLEPMFNVALEGASFINAYNRGTARKLADKLPNSTGKLDAQAARLVAVNLGVSAIVAGSLSSRGNGYRLSVEAIDAVTGKTLASADASAANKDAVLLDIPKLAAPIRKALGDTTPESVQVAAEQGSFTTSNLEAVHQYGIAMDQLFAGDMEQALRSFSNAVKLDPDFARAYAGMAAVYGNLGKTQDAEKDVKLAMEHVDRMTERERYRVRGFYYYTTGNWQQCVQEYDDLIKRFPADNVGQANLSSCYLYLRKIPEAVAAAQRAVDIAPKGALLRVGLSQYSSYDGHFAAGEREARTALELNPSYPAYLALVEAQLGLGQMHQATETYHKLEKVNAMGASAAVSGLADVAAYEGRYADAVRILDQGIAADLAAKNPDRAARKLAALARLQLWRGEKVPAVAAATKASAMSQQVPVRVLAAQTFAETGDFARAQELASGLASDTRPESQAYAKIIDGDLVLHRGEKNQAIKMFTDANHLLDTWIGHFELGRAYLEAGHFVEADSEFDRCMQRRGEALEIFMDNTPTIAYFPFVYYYQGRVREGLKSPGFAEPYRRYLSIRGKAGQDPLLGDIHRRLGQ
jgi:tetratricopeptide (TPR) repeat protein/predicted Ser/Thr protein kinase